MSRWYQNKVIILDRAEYSPCQHHLFQASQDRNKVWKNNSKQRGAVSFESREGIKIASFLQFANQAHGGHGSEHNNISLKWDIHSNSSKDATNTVLVQNKLTEQISPVFSFKYLQQWAVEGLVPQGAKAPLQWWPGTLQSPTAEMPTSPLPWACTAELTQLPGSITSLFQPCLLRMALEKAIKPFWMPSGEKEPRSALAHTAWLTLSHSHAPLGRQLGLQAPRACQPSLSRCDCRDPCQSFQRQSTRSCSNTWIINKQHWCMLHELHHKWRQGS